MFGNGRNTLILKSLVVFLSFAMVMAGFSAGANSDRIIPSGKVSIIKDGQVVGEFSSEAPLPEGSLLRCEEQCVVRLDDVYIVAEPGTVFSVTSTAESHQLYVQEGTIYYSLTESSRPLHFSSPAGDATTGDLEMTDSTLQGYVSATEKAMEIGVISGGTMMLATASGDMEVAPEKAVTIGVSDPDTVGTGTEEPGGLSRGQKVAIGVASAAALAAGGIALAGGGGGGGGGGDDNSGSPASP